MKSSITNEQREICNSMLYPVHSGVHEFETTRIKDLSVRNVLVKISGIVKKVQLCSY